MLAGEGEYVYRSGDMVRVWDEVGECFVALSISSPLHFFGHCKATLKPADDPPFADWGIGPRTVAFCLLSTSPRGTLDGLSIEAPRGTIYYHYTFGVGIDGGDCGSNPAPSPPPRSRGAMRCLLMASPPSHPSHPL